MDSPSASPAGCSSADDGMIIDSDNENNMRDTQPGNNRVLKDVVAYVEVRTKTENRSNSVRKQLELLGAVVVKKFTNEEPVTHVVWKDGTKSTKDKAVKRGLHLVSVLWVDSCKQTRQRAVELLFPVNDGNDGSSIIIPKIKRMKSMQPKTFQEDLESSTERMVRKRKRKELVQPTRLYINSPGAVNKKPFVYVEETQDPYTPVGTAVPGIGGTPSLIPDTPASMRACLDALGRVRNSGNTPRSGSEKPVIGESPTFGAKPDILQKKLSFSPSVDANSSEDGNKGNKPWGKLKAKKGRRSEGGQGSAQKESSKVRRLSLRIEKTLSEQDTDEDGCNPNTNLPKHSEISQTNSVRKSISSLAETVCVDGSKHSLSESEVNVKTAKTTLFCEKEVYSHSETSVNGRRKRKLMSTNTDVIPSQVLTEPAKSRKKDRREKESSISNKLSRNPGDKFNKARDLKELSVDTHPVNSCNNEIRMKSVKYDNSSGRSDKTDEKFSKRGNGSRKRKKEDLSSGSSGEETTKTAKKQKEDKDVSPPAKTAHQQSGDGTMASRRSLEDFAQNKRLNRLKAKRKPNKNRTASLSTLNTSSKDADDGISEKSQKIGKKSSRSLSLTTGDSTTRGGETCSGERLGIKPPKKCRKESAEPDDSSDGSIASSVGIEKAAQQARVKTTKSTKKLKCGKPSLVMTSVHGGDQDLITSVAKKLKRFSMEDNVSKSTTHIVCGESRRTLNVMRGITRGCWLLSVEWVLKSLEAEEWLPEEPYETHDSFPAARMARIERCSAGSSYKQDLFSSLGPVYIHEGTIPPKASLAELLELCGGVTCSSNRQASLCIGGDRNQTKAQVVSEKWLLDCITRHTRLPVDGYLL